MRVKHNGKCHICGSIGPLTFEHIPPESAFNDRTVLIGEFKDIIDKGLGQLHEVKFNNGVLVDIHYVPNAIIIQVHGTVGTM